MINFLILILTLLVLAYLVNYFLVRSFLGWKWRFFVAPGVIVHELSHALACFLTGTKIVKISFFDKEGGQVVHHKSPVPVLGPIIISLAPLAIGILIFYFLANILHFESSMDLRVIYFNFKLLFSSIDFSNWLNLLIIYLLLSIAVTMTPSRQDLINMIVPMILLLGLLYLIAIIIPSTAEPIFVNLSLVLNLVIFILIVCLLISLILYTLTKLALKRT